MIKKYFIHNFKNHADTSLDLSPVTLLTGMNGAGKSSVIQSMLLLRDTYSNTHQLSFLFLKGDSFSVGRTADAVNYNCKEDKERLRYGFVEDNDKTYGLTYRYTMDPEASSLNMEELSGDMEGLMSLPLFTDNFQYLSAFRNGPQEVYDSDKNVVDMQRQLSNKMGRGEMTIYYLSKFGDEHLSIDSLCYAPEKKHTLRQQTGCWMNEISNGLQMQINQYGTRYEVRYGTEHKGKKTIYHSATNTGYGISYILSVVVAILSAKPGALLLIENPEAHIHPSGQSALMRLIAKAAAAGVQVIIETHSDHIINGALVARKQHLMADDALEVYFFERDDDGNAQPIHLEIGQNGMIQNAPDRFCGQMNADLKVLFDLE